jgi:hypothetical protein
MNAHPGTENDGGNNFFGLIYVKPWTRIGPFAVGLLVGYLIYLNRMHPKKFCLNKVRLSVLQTLVNWHSSWYLFVLLDNQLDRLVFDVVILWIVSFWFISKLQW